MRPFCLVVIATVVSACASPPAAAPGSAAPTAAAPAAAPADRVDGATARKLVAEGATLVDVRGADEFATTHLDGAVNVPVADVATHDFGGKEKALVLYCASGARSARAAEALRGAGYTRVYVLGAMSAWGP